MYLALLRSRIGRAVTGAPRMSLPAGSVLDPNRIPAPRDSGGRKGKSRCGSEGSRIRAYECPRWSARCRLQEDPQTTRHKAERHKVVRTKMQTPILGCGRTHCECCPPILTSPLKTLEALKTPAPKHGLEVHATFSLLRCITFFRFTRKSPHIIHEIPNVIRGLDVTKSRHSGGAGSILDDPK